MKLTDIIVTPLRRIETVGGDVMHALKMSDVGYVGFEEAYFSWIASGVKKGWKCHALMTMNLVVPVGKVRFVFREITYQGLDEFRVEEIGLDRYVRITVPPGIWFAFQGISHSESLVLNISSILHDPNEVSRLAISDINFDWG